MSNQNVLVRAQIVGEQGNILFHALIVLPILLGLVAAVLDISRWYTKGNEVQHLADRLALKAAQFLPDRQAAESVILSAGQSASKDISQLLEETLLYFPTSGTQSIGIKIKAQSSATLSKLFIEGDDGFPIYRKAVAQVVPMDSIFILADGATLRPSLHWIDDNSVRTTAPWGDRGEWPQSGYFRCARPPLMPLTNSSPDWESLWADDLFQRLATQSCFNPAFSALKVGVIGVLDELEAGKENRIGLLFSPGNDPHVGFQVLKPLKDDEDRQSQIQWQRPTEIDHLLGDEVCLLFSSPRTSLEGRYALPVSRLPNQRVLQCEEPIEGSVCGSAHRNTDILSRCFLDNTLSLRQAVYWHAARPEGTEPNIIAALQEAFQQLRSAAQGSSGRALRELRGNLWPFSQKTIYLLTDNLSQLTQSMLSFRSLISDLQAEKIELVIIAYSHEHLSDLARTELFSSFTKLQTLRGKDHTLILHLANSAEDLQYRVLPRLLLQTRQIVLRN